MYLNDKGFVCKSRGQAQLAHEGGFIDEVLNAVEDSTTSGWDSPMNTTLADGLTSHTGMSIDILQRDQHKIRQIIIGLHFQ